MQVVDKSQDVVAPGFHLQPALGLEQRDAPHAVGAIEVGCHLLLGITVRVRQFRHGDICSVLGDRRHHFFI